MTALDPAYLAHFQIRVLQDAYAETTSSYWHRRGRAFDDARPRRTDFNGRATPGELVAAWHRCSSVATACRIRAEHGARTNLEFTATVLDYAPEMSGRLEAESALERVAADSEADLRAALDAGNEILIAEFAGRVDALDVLGAYIHDLVA